MWLKSFRLKNFKSFQDSRDQKLNPHVNVIVGQNSSGKTALLQSISLQLSSIPHKSSRIGRNDQLNPRSTFDFQFAMSGAEFRELLLSFQQMMYIPIPREWAAISQQSRGAILANLFRQDEITFHAQQYAQEGSRHIHQVEAPSISFEGLSSGHYVQVSRNEERSDFIVHSYGGGGSDDVVNHVAPYIMPRIYFFDAQRSPRSQYQFGDQSRLSPDAENLAQVLGTLQPSPTAYRKYVETVRRVLPQIKWISVVPRGSDSEIRIWHLDEVSERSDLAVPLAQCGTGVGQVLSLLYVVTQSSGNVIVIDEPTSFLHPRAAKELVSILREDKGNQYIVSTHSSEVIAAIEPSQLFALSFEDEQTIIKVVGGNDLRGTREVLDVLGTRLSDVFGADYVIWVEGPTEVNCFPVLLRAAGLSTFVGLAVAALRSTGDLEGKHAKIAADIYRNLSSSHAILPITLAVSLDGDKREELQNSAVLKTAFGDVLRFLPRRCFENYLIDPEAISALLNELPYFHERQTSPDAIEEWMRSRGNDPVYGADEKVLSPDWLVKVDAPKLLEDLFQDVSDATEIYRKTSHSQKLIEWLLEKKPLMVQELVKYVGSLVNKPL